MDGILRTRQPVLNGIVNGIDEFEWDPSTDKFIAAQYNASDLTGIGWVHTTSTIGFWQVDCIIYEVYC